VFRDQSAAIRRAADARRAGDRPLNSPEAALDERLEPQASQAQEQPILIVEDDDDIRDFVTSILKDAGYAVMAAENGAAALARIEQAPPRAILLDMKMPVMDGWEFARRYHQRPKATQAPIIVMTAAHDAVQRAAQVEAVDVLGKPFDLDELLDTVARAVERAG
jgi:two-component system chemotaxis response regulator CheY